MMDVEEKTIAQEMRDITNDVKNMFSAEVIKTGVLDDPEQMVMFAKMMNIFNRMMDVSIRMIEKNDRVMDKFEKYLDENSK